MTKYAAHDDFAIYAIGATAEEAIANARDAARDDEARFDATPISETDAAKIEADGFDGMCDGFGIEGGWIVLYLRRDRTT